MKKQFQGCLYTHNRPVAIHLAPIQLWKVTLFSTGFLVMKQQ